MNAATKWGVISGLSAGVWTVFIMILEINGIAAGSTGIIPAWIFYIAGIYLGILQTRVNELGNIIDMRTGFRTGLRSAAFGGLIWNIFNLGFYLIISKEALAKLFPLDNEIQLETRKTVAMQLTSFIIGTVYTILIGAFIAILLSFILKKDPEQEEPGA